MPCDVVVSLDDLESALHWVSADGALENSAFIAKMDGAIYYSSADGFVEDEVPEDLDDVTQYWSVPHKNELDLGRSLVLRYVRESLPEDYRLVQDFFHRRGAYAQFKALLRRREHLERWHAYENQAVQQALLQWAEDCGFRVIGSPRQRAGT